MRPIEQRHDMTTVMVLDKKEKHQKKKEKGNTAITVLIFLPKGN